MCYIYIGWTELRGVPTEFVVKLIPQHAKKQCPFLGIWESSIIFSEKKRERERKQQLRGYLSIDYINILLNRRVALAYTYSIIG